MTEEEKEHLNYLDKTYRDRAKERREAEADNIEEEYVNPDPNLFDGEDDNGMPKGGVKKGLDFDLLRREREKAEEEMMEQSLEQKQEVFFFFSQNIYSCFCIFIGTQKNDRTTQKITENNYGVSYS